MKILIEGNIEKLNLVRDFLKLEIAYGAKAIPDYDVAIGLETRRAKSLGMTLDEIRAELQKKWKPGPCPHCKGTGIIIHRNGAFENDPFCSATGLYGMSSAQGSWYVKMMNEIEKGHVKYKKADPSQIANEKFAKDIVSAGKKLGIKLASKWNLEPEDGEAAILSHEYYQGHEQDFYFDSLEAILREIATKAATKAGWKGSSYA